MTGQDENKLWFFQNRGHLPRFKRLLSKTSNLKKLINKLRLAKQSAFKSQFDLWRFCPHLGYNDSPFEFQEALQFIRCLPCYDFFYLNSYETPFSAWNNFITWKLHFYSCIARWAPDFYSFTSFHWSLINSMRARCPLDDITRRKHFTLRGSECLFNSLCWVKSVCLSVCQSVYRHIDATVSVHNRLMLHS